MCPAWTGRSMTPTVLLLLLLLLLSVLPARARACDPLVSARVQNLQSELRHETSSGFLKVFPEDYTVPHHSHSTQCPGQNATCCVFTEAVLLSHSWTQLLQQLNEIHLKRKFITDVKQQLDCISSNAWKFQMPPEPSAFPSAKSSPIALLTSTSSLFSEWLDLNCPTGKLACTSPNPLPTEEGDIPYGGTEEEYGGNTSGEETARPKEGEREKRWITVIPTNGDTGSSMSPGLLLCALSSLRMVMDVLV